MAAAGSANETLSASRSRNTLPRRAISPILTLENGSPSSRRTSGIAKDTAVDGMRCQEREERGRRPFLRRRKRTFHSSAQHPREAARRPLALVLIIDVAEHVRRCGLGRQRLDIVRKPAQLVLRILVIKALRGRRKPLSIPCAVVAAMQSHNRQRGIGHLPHGGNR